MKKNASAQQSWVIRLIPGDGIVFREITFGIAVGADLGPKAAVVAFAEGEVKGEVKTC